MSKTNKLKKFLASTSMMAIAAGVAGSFANNAQAGSTVTFGPGNTYTDTLAGVTPAATIPHGALVVKSGNASAFIGSEKGSEAADGYSGPDVNNNMDFQSGMAHIAQVDYAGYYFNLVNRGLGSKNSGGPLSIGNIIDSGGVSTVYTNRQFVHDWGNDTRTIFTGPNPDNIAWYPDYSAIMQFNLGNVSESTLAVDARLPTDAAGSSWQWFDYTTYFNGAYNASTPTVTEVVNSHRANLEVNTSLVVNHETWSRYHRIDIGVDYDDPKYNTFDKSGLGGDHIKPATLVFNLANKYIEQSTNTGARRLHLMHNDKIRAHWTKDSTDPAEDNIERASINFKHPDSEIVFSVLSFSSNIKHDVRMRDGNKLGGNNHGVITVEAVKHPNSNGAYSANVGWEATHDAGSSIGTSPTSMAKAFNARGNDNIFVNRPIYAQDINVSMTEPGIRMILGSTGFLGTENRTSYVERLNFGVVDAAAVPYSTAIGKGLVRIYNDNPAIDASNDNTWQQGQIGWWQRHVQPTEMQLGRDFRVIDYVKDATDPIHSTNYINFNGADHRLSIYYQNLAKTATYGNVVLIGNTYGEFIDPSLVSSFSDPSGLTDKVAGILSFFNESVYEGTSTNIKLWEVKGTRKASVMNPGAHTVGNIAFINADSTLWVADGFRLDFLPDGSGATINDKTDVITDKDGAVATITPTAESGHLMFGGAGYIAGNVGVEHALKSIQAQGAGKVEFPGLVEAGVLEIRHDDAVVDFMYNFNAIKAADGKIRYYDDGEVIFSATTAGADKTVHSPVEVHKDNIGTLTLAGGFTLSQKVGNNGAALKQINTGTGTTIFNDELYVHNLNLNDAAAIVDVNSMSYIFGPVTNTAAGTGVLNLNAETKFLGKVGVDAAGAASEIAEINVNPGSLLVTFADDVNATLVTVDNSAGDAKLRVQKTLTPTDHVLLKNDATVQLMQDSRVEGAIYPDVDGSGEVFIERNYDINHDMGTDSANLRVITAYGPGVIKFNTDAIYTKDMHFASRDARVHVNVPMITEINFTAENDRYGSLIINSESEFYANVGVVGNALNHIQVNKDGNVSFFDSIIAAKDFKINNTLANVSFNTSSINTDIIFEEDGVVNFTDTTILGNVTTKVDNTGTLNIVSGYNKIDGFTGSDGYKPRPLLTVNVDKATGEFEQDIHAKTIKINSDALNLGQLRADQNVYGDVEFGAGGGLLALAPGMSVNAPKYSEAKGAKSITTLAAGKGFLDLGGANEIASSVGTADLPLFHVDLRNLGRGPTNYIFRYDVHTQEVNFYASGDDVVTFQGKLFTDFIHTDVANGNTMNFQDSVVVTGTTGVADVALEFSGENVADYIKLINLDGDETQKVEFQGTTYVTDLFINRAGTVALANVAGDDDFVNGITFNDDQARGRVLIEGAGARVVPKLNINRGAKGTLEIANSVGANTVTFAGDIGDSATGVMLKHLVNNNVDGEFMMTGASNAIQEITSAGGTLHMNAGAAQELMALKVNLTNNDTIFKASNDLTLKSPGLYAGTMSYGDSMNKFKSFDMAGTAVLKLEDRVNFYALAGTNSGAAADLELAGDNIFSAPNAGGVFNKLDVTGVNKTAKIEGEHAFDGPATISQFATLELDSNITAPTIDGPGILKTVNGPLMSVNAPVGTLAPANIIIGGGDVTFASAVMASDYINFEGVYGHATVTFADAGSMLDTNYANTSKGNEVTYVLPATTNVFTKQLGTAEGGDNVINFHLDTGVIADLSGDVSLYNANFDTLTASAGELIFNSNNPIMMNNIGASNPLAKVTYNKDGGVIDGIAVDDIEINAATATIGGTITGNSVNLTGGISKLILKDGATLDSAIAAAAGEVIAEGNITINQNITGSADRISFSNHANSVANINIAKIEATLTEFNRGFININQNLEVTGNLDLNNSHIDLKGHTVTSGGVMKFTGENRISLDITSLALSAVNTPHHYDYGDIANYPDGEYYLYKIDSVDNGHLIANGGVEYTPNTQIIVDARDQASFYPHHEISFEDGSRIKVLENNGAEVAPLDINNFIVENSDNTTLTLMPEIENGSLYLTVKNWTPAPEEGEQGPQGPQGEDGIIGATGGPGIAGEQGPIGDTGVDGPVGNIGPVGIDGVQGPVGDRGLDGPDGPAGPAGPAGTAGGGGAGALAGVSPGAAILMSTLGMTQEEAEEFEKELANRLTNRADTLANDLAASIAGTTISDNGQISGTAAGGCEGTKYGAWFNPFYNYTVQRNHKDSIGYISKRFGANLGIDIQANENMIVGAAATFAHSDISHKNVKAGDKTEMNSYMLSLYGVHMLTDRWFANTLGTIGVHHTKLTDVRKGLNGTEKVKSNYDTMSVLGEAMLGYKMPSDYGTFSPMFGLRYIRVNEASYKLVGSFDTHVKTKATNILEAVVGAKMAFGPMQLADTKVTPSVHAFVEHDLIGKAPTVEIDLVSQGQGVDIKKRKAIRTEFTVGFDINAEKGMFEYGVGYDCKIALKRIGHEGSLTLRVNF